MEMKIVGVDRVTNGVLRGRFLDMCEKLKKAHPSTFHKRWVFHGCAEKYLDSILEKGLLNLSHPLMPEGVRATDQGYFGSTNTGVYVAANIDYAAKYSVPGLAPLEPGQRVKVLALEAALGRGYQFRGIAGPKAKLPDTAADHGISQHGHEFWLVYANQCSVRFILHIEAFRRSRDSRCPDDGMRMDEHGQPYFFDVEEDESMMIGYG